MPGPSFVFGFILATFYGALFHLLAGGDARRLALFLLAGWLGFVLGQVIGAALNVTVLDVGPVHALTASLGSWLALFAAWLLTGRLKARKDAE